MALGVDFIAPEGYGEIIGGGQRIHDLDLLLKRIDEAQAAARSVRLVHRSAQVRHRCRTPASAWAWSASWPGCAAWSTSARRSRIRGCCTGRGLRIHRRDAETQSLRINTLVACALRLCVSAVKYTLCARRRLRSSARRSTWAPDVAASIWGYRRFASPTWAAAARARLQVADLGNVRWSSLSAWPAGPRNARYLPQIAHTCTRTGRERRARSRRGQLPLVHRRRSLHRGRYGLGAVAKHYRAKKKSVGAALDRRPRGHEHAAHQSQRECSRHAARLHHRRTGRGR